MTATPLFCAKCQRPLRSYFKVERVAEAGTTTVSAVTCSIPCLISWTYGYATLMGMMGAAKAKSLLDGVLGLLQGK